MVVVPIINQELMSTLRAALNYLPMQLQITAENISNVNTPHYKTKVLKEFNEYLTHYNTTTHKQNLALSITAPAHLAPKAADHNSLLSFEDNEGELKPNGNNVALLAQTQQLTKYQLQYSEALVLYKKVQSLLSAVSRGKV